MKFAFLPGKSLCDIRLARCPPFTHLPFASASWGKTPEFSHQFETRIDGVGVFDVHLKVASRFSFGGGDNGSSIDTSTAILTTTPKFLPLVTCYLQNLSVWTLCGPTVGCFKTSRTVRLYFVPLSWNDGALNKLTPPAICFLPCALHLADRFCFLFQLLCKRFCEKNRTLEHCQSFFTVVRGQKLHKHYGTMLFWVGLESKALIHRSLDETHSFFKFPSLCRTCHL